MPADKLTKLGDALDAEERWFRATWPNRPLGHALFAGRTIEPAYDAYRNAVVMEVAQHPSSAFSQRIWNTKWPDTEPASLRQLVDKYAQFVMRWRADEQRFQNRIESERQRQNVVRRYPRRKPRVRRIDNE